LPCRPPGARTAVKKPRPSVRLERWCGSSSPRAGGHVEARSRSLLLAGHRDGNSFAVGGETTRRLLARGAGLRNRRRGPGASLPGPPPGGGGGRKGRAVGGSGRRRVRGVAFVPRLASGLGGKRDRGPAGSGNGPSEAAHMPAALRPNTSAVRLPPPALGRGSQSFRGCNAPAVGGRGEYFRAA